VFLELVIVHSLTYFIQKVGQESLGLGQGDLWEKDRTLAFMLTPLHSRPRRCSQSVWEHTILLVRSRMRF
jgi:hypothetical protein